MLPKFHILTFDGESSAKCHLTLDLTVLDTMTNSRVIASLALSLSPTRLRNFAILRLYGPPEAAINKSETLNN